MRFLRSNREALTSIPVATVTVCMAAADNDEQARADARGYVEPVLADLQLDPVARWEAPGWMLLDKFSWPERMVLKMTKNDKKNPGDHRDFPAARAWAREIAPLLAGR